MRSTHRPEDLPPLLAGVGAPWWVAGGWALDLFLGGAPRPHEDLDVAVLRRDEGAFVRALAGWDLRAGLGEGVVEDAPLAGPLPPGRHAIWCRPEPRAPWAFELLLNEASGDEWTFRRDARVRRPLASLGARTAAGIPFLAPEVVLLYKAKALRRIDEEDFARVAPRLDGPARAWLADALDLAHPGHPWAAAARTR